MFIPRSPFPVLIIIIELVIRLDGLASQTGFQTGLSPKCNVVLCIVSMLRMPMSVMPATWGREVCGLWHQD